MAIGTCLLIGTLAGALSLGIWRRPREPSLLTERSQRFGNLDRAMVKQLRDAIE
jgi:hypothetical protein